ncbi:hypothetical protein NMS01_003148 [Vibrio cholerae]|nr:hypothetical protein [Vibrio cholerae]
MKKFTAEEMKAHTEAYNQGFEARKSGLAKNANPYPVFEGNHKSTLCECWAQGYADCTDVNHNFQSINPVESIA